LKWRDNNLRRRLGREPLAAFWMAMGSTTIVELAGAAAPDAFIIDMQHGLWDRATLETAVGTVPADASVLVRVAENSAVAIGQALDTGAEGVIVPLVESAEEAAQAVAAARFPPHGRRSGGGVRPLAAGFMDYCAGADERTVVGVMIETARGVDNAAAIAGTAGVDFVLIGTGDLALSLARDDAHPHRHEEACRAVREACRKAGISCAIFTTGAEQAAARAAEGYDMVVPANDIGVVAQGFAAAMQTFRKEAGGKNEG
jgi:2-keto-3-deoxy-L-rhamnonate aldolase RhmA